MSLIEQSIELGLIQFNAQLRISQKEGKTYIFDPVRKKNIVLQPEEFVRQLFVHWIIKETNFSRNSIQVEKMVLVNNNYRRFDIVIYDKNTKPYILVECKAPEVRISQHTFDQVAAYNMPLLAPYLVVTNGVLTWCVKMNHELKRYDFLQQIPKE